MARAGVYSTGSVWNSRHRADMLCHMTGKVPAEFALLLACSRGVAPESQARVRELARNAIDWPCFLSLVRRHGLGPLVWRHFSADVSGTMPGDTRDALHADVRANAVRGWALTSELLELVGLLEHKGIPVIPYKGPVLALQAFGDVALRQYADLDLLVRADEMSAARAVLAACGYRPYLALAPAQEASYVRAQGHLPMVRGDGKVMVELHTEVTPRAFGFELDTAKLWGRLGRVDVWGRELPALTPEDHLLVLCAHGAKHRWSSLGWVGDIAGLIGRTPTLNWEQIVRHAREVKSERMLLAGLGLVRELFEVSLPSGLCEAIDREPHVATLASEITARLARVEPEAYGFRHDCRFFMRIRSPWVGLRYCLGQVLLPTPAEWTLVSLPAWLAFVYHAIRPIRLIAKHGRRLLVRDWRVRWF